MHRASLLLLALLACRAGLGVGLAARLPAWEAYDEPFHFAYAAQIARQGTLPDSSNPMHIHPPAYYALVAAFMWLSGSHQTPLAAPDHNWYLYEGNGGINFALPPRTAEQRSTERDLIAARLFTALFALLGVALTWRAARAVGLSAPFALIGTLFFACHPQALFSSSTLNNDAASLLSGALIAWSLVVSIEQRSGRLALLALLLSGLGSFFKLSSLPLAMAAYLALILCVSWRRALVYALIGAIVIVLSALNLQAMGALLPFAIEINGQAAPIAVWQRLTSELGGLLLGEALQHGALSAFGVFGWGTVKLPLWMIAALWLGTLSGALGVVRLWHRRAIWVLSSAWIALMLSGLALSLLYYNAQLLNSRYLLPSLAAWSIVLAMGWRALGSVGRFVGAGTVCGMLGLSAWLSLGGLEAFYAPPIEFVTPSGGGTPLTAEIKLHAYEVLSPTVRGGEPLEVALTWGAEGRIDEHYTLRLAFIGADGNIYGWLYTFHGAGRYPTGTWRAGTAFREVYRVPIRHDVPAPSIGYVQVMLVELKRAILLDAVPIAVH
ncbi:MAG: glycosyltransferase family 39 protein [Aggregatilineales bacterium]